MQVASQASVNTLNYLGNMPENLVHLGGDFPLEWVTFSKTLDRPGNIALGDREQGVIIFCHMHDGVYEGHYLMNPKCTGKEKLTQCRKIFDTLFTLYEASAIVGHIPIEHFGARVMTRALGFASTGVSADHNGCSCVNYTLERKQWAALSADWSQRAGNT